MVLNRLRDYNIAPAFRALPFVQLRTRTATTPHARALHRDVGDQRLVALVAAIMKS
jgi:hypothetical protein